MLFCFLKGIDEVMKKFKFFGLLLLVLIGFTACSLKNVYLKELSYSELVKKIENEDTFFFTIVQDGCSHCTAFTPKFEEILKEYDLTGYKLNITNLSDEDHELFEERFGTSIATPTTIFLVSGKEESQLTRLVGNLSKSKIVDRLKTAGYIK